MAVGGILDHVQLVYHRGIYYLVIHLDRSSYEMTKAKLIL